MTAPLADRGRYRRVDRVATRDHSFIPRVFAVIACAVPTAIGLMAVALIDWSAGGFEAPAVQVAGMTFTPWVAVGTAAIGLIALFVACTRDRVSDLVMGALLLIGAFVIFAADPGNKYVILEDGHAWMAAGVGVVLLLAAAVLSWMTPTTTSEEVIDLRDEPEPEYRDAPTIRSRHVASR